MTYSEAQKNATIKYKKKNYKRIPLDISIKDYEKIKQHTENTSESINGFIKRAINETMERDTLEFSEASSAPGSSEASSSGFSEASSAPSDK